MQTEPRNNPGTHADKGEKNIETRQHKKARGFFSSAAPQEKSPLKSIEVQTSKHKRTLLHDHCIRPVVKLPKNAAVCTFSSSRDNWG